MGVIVCQRCERVIEFFESNQVKKLYAACKSECEESGCCDAE